MNAPEVKQLVEDAAAFIASSDDRPSARGIIRDAIDHQVEEIDAEAKKFLGDGKASTD